MDLQETIRQLKIGKERIECAIAVLEELLSGGAGDPTHLRKRRGRKSMSAEERQEVSQRMKRYWANRHQRQLD